MRNTFLYCLSYCILDIFTLYSYIYKVKLYSNFTFTILKWDFFLPEQDFLEISKRYGVNIEDKPWKVKEKHSRL